MQNKKLYWGANSSFELKALIEGGLVVILPIGAYEQHGPHLPVDTDTHIGVSIAEKAVMSAKESCVLLPSIWAGVSRHHMDFCGTISLSHNTIVALTRDIIRSLYHHGVRKVLLLNSHGGNISILKSCLEMFGSELSMQIVLVTYWDLVKELVEKNRSSGWGGISHGGELETSLKLYLNPEDVSKNNLIPNIVKGNPYFSPEMFSPNLVSIYASFSEFSKYGHIGDPTKASASFGEIVFNAVVEELVRIIDLMGDDSLIVKKNKST